MIFKRPLIIFKINLGHQEIDPEKRAQRLAEQQQQPGDEGSEEEEEEKDSVSSEFRNFGLKLNGFVAYFYICIFFFFLVLHYCFRLFKLPFVCFVCGNKS